MNGTRAPRITRPILIAAVISFGLDVLLDPPARTGDLLLRATLFPVAVLFAYLIGRWLGARTWRRRGRRIAGMFLRAAARDRRRVIYLTDRPDFPASHWRRTWEVVGFAAGTSVIIAAVLVFAGLTGASLTALSMVFVLGTMWLAFILVPYWAFAQLGLRQVDTTRWLILPLGKTYADRMKLSNGALLILGLGAAFNVAYRAGATQEQAFIDGGLALARIVASVLVMAATAVAYYERDEARLIAELQDEAIAVGIRDGRLMTDAQFLPPGAHAATMVEEPEPMMPLLIWRTKD